eukprot:CAMPEP_0118809470 /NCGR_PEP_ID=MMETSP1162-20130426/291_1 /TAXON_ID=33656 /ORGANISM="Phaeocystis Sp, Strain CCMP2710" /LENGTH=88 /DNA_ID=CAMNT_0006738903 /DNA_START=564 /DNA_END=827 /DNA_ORIENTATION=-
MAAAVARAAAARATTAGAVAAARAAAAWVAAARAAASRAAAAVGAAAMGLHVGRGGGGYGYTAGWRRRVRLHCGLGYVRYGDAAGGAA